MAQQNPTFSFQMAQREAAKASIMIEGLTGRGKTGLALLIAYALTKDWTKIAHIDTENKSANLFVGIPSSGGGKFEPFMHGDLNKAVGFKPSNFLAFRETALQNGAEVVIKDSISHAWQYAGGLLDLVTQAKERTAKKNDAYAAWGDPEVMKEKNELLELIRSPKCHVITTVRVKEKFDYDQSGEKTKLVSLGEQQIQQADLKYEPDLVLHMIRSGKNKNGEVRHPIARVIKSRYAIFDEEAEYEFTPELLEQLRAYLADGIDPDILLEQQRQDYINAVKQLIADKPSIKPIWAMAKKDAGYESTRFEDMPLGVIKNLFIKIT